MTALKYSVGLSLCVFWEEEVTWSQGWWNACAPDLTCYKGGKVWNDMQGSKLCMCKSVCARACNICVGHRTENHEVGEGGVRCWWWNEFQTGTAFSPQGLPAPCGCCLGNGWGIMRNAWKLYPSVGLMDGVKRGGWLFSVYFFFIFSRLDRQVAVVMTWRRSPAHLHHKQRVLPTQT